MITILSPHKSKDLKFIKIALDQSDAYDLADEYRIEAFDFLEEFVLGFLPEQFLAEVQRSLPEDSVDGKHKNIVFLYCPKTRRHLGDQIKLITAQPYIYSSILILPFLVKPLLS